MPYIIRCHVEDIREVKKALREEILHRGSFPPWDEDSDMRWFDAATDRAPLAMEMLRVARKWVVAYYDGTRWMVPTTEGWRESG